MNGQPIRARKPWRSQGAPDDPHEELAPRQDAAYTCDRGGHSFDVTFAAKVTPPASWPCRCGGTGTYTGPGPAVAESRRSAPRLDDDLGHHMRLVRQRRTPAELEQILAERITEVRQARESGCLCS